MVTTAKTRAPAKTARGRVHPPSHTHSAPTAPDAPVTVIHRVAVETISVPIIGTAPLIVHRWSEKAKQQMLDTQQGRKTPKQIRDPNADYEASLYRLKDGYGFPVLAFKEATVDAAAFYGKSVAKTNLRKFIFMTGEWSEDGRDLLTPIVGEPVMREDMVRVGISGTDLRYRGEFREWSARLIITYVTTALSRDSVLSLVDAGGLGVGVGQWRPEKSGQNGTYAIDESQTVDVIT